MCTVLIATDFTPAAKNAIQYGIQLAKGMHGNVVLVHVIKPMLFNADTLQIISREELAVESKVILEKEIAALENVEVPIKIKVVFGNVTEKIVAISREENASWIVLGMKAKDKSMRKIFGSNAVSICKYSFIPLIIVPENAAYKPPCTIALANDLDENANLEILNPLQQLGLHFQSYLFLLKVINDGNPQLIKKIIKPNSIQLYLKELNTEYEYLDDLDFTHAITQFVKNKNVDVVAMISREHNLLERIFTRSHIKEMMYETSVPLIILPGIMPKKKGNNLNKVFGETKGLNKLKAENVINS